MIFDLASGEVNAPAKAFDVAIAGGGIAGMIVALKLARAGFRPALIEAGGLDVASESQALYHATARGAENLPLDQTRGRCLGGSSNLWGGWCRPLDPIDFRRGYLAGGGWPIGPEALSPFLPEAMSLLGLTRVTGADLELAGSEGELQTIQMLFSTPPARFNLRFINEIRSSSRIAVFLNAPVVGAEFDKSNGSMQALVYSPPGGGRAKVEARMFVLAMGAIENSRMLLLWNRDHAERLGNESGLVGRYYMQHLHQELGRLISRDRSDFGSQHSDQTTPAYFAASPRYLSDAATGAFRVYSMDLDCVGLPIGLNGATMAACTMVRPEGRLLVTAEQEPVATNRIQLANDSDELGLPRVLVDWRTSDKDKRTLTEAGRVFNRYLARTNLGRLELNSAILEGNDPIAGWTLLASAPGAAGHQMGGARMSLGPRDGVIDPNCRVWGTQNLFVAGSAIFPAFGHVPPTLTIAQTSLRMADELQRRLGTH